MTQYKKNAPPVTKARRSGVADDASGEQTGEDRSTTRVPDPLRHLKPEHRNLIRASAVSDEVALERGYKSIQSINDWGDSFLDDFGYRIEVAGGGLGFSKNQKRLGLVMPIYWKGEVVSYQLRPDTPWPAKKEGGKEVKYKTRSGDPVRLDCLPSMWQQLRKRSVEAWFTEGIRKADAATSLGQSCIALTGVWNWTRKNTGQLIADFKDIPLRDRVVYLIFDSDADSNPRVGTALRRLAKRLARRGALVQIVTLPPGADGEKVGLDDFLAAGHTLDDVRALAAAYEGNVPADQPTPPGYVVPDPWSLTEKGIEREGKDGPVLISHVPLALIARLVAEDRHEALRLTWRRDGIWRTKDYDRDTLASTGKIVALAADGIGVTTGNAHNLVEYLADSEAANLERLPIVRMTDRLGWFGEGTNAFTASGAGLTVVRVGDGLDDRLGSYRASGTLLGWLATIELGADHPSILLGMCAGLAPVMLRIVGVDSFVIDLSGPTGSGKTTVARVPSSIWGAPELMVSWETTRVAIERRAGMLAGLPLVVDETQLAGFDVTEVIYEIASGQGRGRGAKAGGLVRTERWETILISTGERPITTFGRQAAGVRGRVVSVDGRPLPEGSPELANHLRDGLAEHYGQLGPAFAEHVADAGAQQQELWRERYRELRADLRGAAASDVEGRRAELVAVLALAGEVAQTAGLVPWKLPDEYWRSLLTSGAGVEDDDRASAALMVAWSYANSHADKFWSLKVERGVAPHDGWKGRWDEPASTKGWIGFRGDVLTQVLSNSGYELAAVVGIWKERGWLMHDKNRRTKKAKMVKGYDNLYAIWRAAVREASGPRP